MARTTDHGHNRFTRYILTYTGQRVYEAGAGVDGGCPNLTDIAVQCGRVPRFVGATTIFYPVLLHHFLVYDIVKAMGGKQEAQLEALMHDGHEACTGDMPSPFKPSVVSVFQAELDERIRAHFRIPEPDPRWEAMVKDADSIALLAEAALIGPPGSEEWVREAGGADQDAAEALQFVLATYPGYADYLEANGSAVRDYIKLFESLLEEVRA